MQVATMSAPAPAPRLPWMDQQALVKLTGFKYAKRQAEKLKEFGIPYHQNGLGEIIVFWRDFENSPQSPSITAPRLKPVK